MARDGWRRQPQDSAAVLNGNRVGRDPFIPPGDTSSKFLFETKLVAGTVLSILLGLILYYRGARQKREHQAG